MSDRYSGPANLGVRYSSPIALNTPPALGIMPRMQTYTGSSFCSLPVTHPARVVP